MKKKIYKICGVALALVLVFSLFGAFIPVNQVEADPGEVAWSGIANPGGTLRTGLNLADADVGPIAVTPDGATLFAAVNCETAIASVGALGAFSLAAGETLLLTESGGGATGNWTVLTGSVAPTSTGVVGPPFSLAAGTGEILTLTENAVATATGTFVITSGAVITAGTGTVTAPRQWALLESTDGGYNWTATDLTSNPGPITGIAISPYFATDGTMYVAAGSPTTGVAAVFRSTDSGATFTEIKGVPREIGANTPTMTINSIAMWPASPYPYIMVGTDTDVWVLQDMPFGGWMDQEINNAGAVNILEVAFAPDFATTNFIWAVTAAGVVTATNSPGAWGTILANTAALATSASADIAFPDDYDSSTSPYLWVGLNDGTGAPGAGGVWRIRGLGPPGPSQDIPQLGIAVPGGTNVNIRSIAVSGSMASATILAGDEDAAAIYKSESGGLMWPGTAVVKQPTGTGVTYVVMAPDFATSGLAYVGTSDVNTTESAFQVSGNAGLSWNQTGLVDVPLVAGLSALNTIDDIAVVSQSTVFMVANGTDLWKTTDATATAPIWERILTSTTATMPPHVLANITLVANSPEFATDGVVYATDNATVVVKSTDGGDIFAPMGAPTTAITALYVVDATFAFTGAAAQVYRTDDGGYSWLAATIPPAGTVVSFATSPDYANDSTLLVGNGNGQIHRSENGGATFSIVGAAIGAFDAYVTFDPEYATNSLIYAGGDALISRYDFTATALGWVSIDATITTGVVTACQFTYAVTGGTVNVVVASDADGDVTIVGSTITLPDLTDAIVITATTAGSAATLTMIGVSTVTGTITQDLGVPNVAIGGFPPYTITLPDVGDAVTVTYAAASGPAVGASVINGLLTSPDGTIYGSNALLLQGVERSLNPTSGPPGPWPTFERMIDQLPAGAILGTAVTPASLELVVDPALDVIGSKNVLFAIDTANIQILTYTDTLATTIVLTEPADGTIFPRETAVTMAWEELTGADTYHWQISTDAGFRLTPVDEGYTGYTSDSSGVLAAGRTYYWRVRVEDAAGVGDPLLSRWSNDPAYESAAHWSFTTFLGERPWHPFDPMSGVSPSPGATDVPVKPTFQWNGADWAATYDLELADNSAFTGAIKKTLSATAWTCDPALDYGTTYYWKVKAVSDVTESEWTDVGVFTTVAEVVPPAKVYSCPQCGLEFSTEAALQAHWDKFHAPPTPVKPITPAYIWAIIGVGALLVVAVIVLILRTRRVA